MKISDVIVIGSGLAGLMAAAVATSRNQSVTVLSYGSGSLPLASGTIDFLNVKNPLDLFKKLPKYHPYQKIGANNIEAAAKFFINLMKQVGLPYVGKITEQIPVITAIGTIKYSSLVPASMDATALASAKKVFVASVEGLKDFYPKMIIDNLKKVFPNKIFDIIKLDLHLLGGRDITCMDAAQFISADDLKFSTVTSEDAIIIPPILGLDTLIKPQTNAKIFETTCLPPSPPGIRLQRAFKKFLENAGVKIFENTKVVRGIFEGQKISGVVVENAVREKIFRAKKFILATGGFYSGGIEMREFDKPKEVVFKIPVFCPVGADNWGNEQLFSDKPQGFSMTGLFTNDKLNPIDGNGKVLFDNLHVIGANLGGCDKIFERSAGGIAISSAYAAAI